ncbi:hypothetical protein PR048_023748 [Dryococelus australis]|uniref:DUF5641 domain-containing protein n=1 Tax=Dryococelus australis TaxID=614101 RepID=A0ABQ9GV02_9NEOP|nr:hypothetical protein PR048_023748 [Dryococelus australis]
MEMEDSGVTGTRRSRLCLSWLNKHAYWRTVTLGGDGERKDCTSGSPRHLARDEIMFGGGRMNPTKLSSPKTNISHSSSTRLRVVFDVSANTGTGNSLNDLLFIGPVVQDHLLKIVIRFRGHRYALTADIEKLYRQILVLGEQRVLQRIYGAAFAPFLATETLQKLTEEDRYSFPVASEIMNQDFYVEDLMTGADTIEEATRVQQDLTMVRSIEETDAVKTLGLLWRPSKALTFESLGFIGPISVTPKLIMQELWQRITGGELCCNMQLYVFCDAPEAAYRAYIYLRFTNKECPLRDAWHHVKSGDNPADLRSVGMTPERLIATYLRGKWPKWLRGAKGKSIELTKPSLQQRAKWRVQGPNAKLDSLVLLKEDNVPPLCWKLARVKQLHPGKDGLVWAVTLQTAPGGGGTQESYSPTLSTPRRVDHIRGRNVRAKELRWEASTPGNKESEGQIPLVLMKQRVICARKMPRPSWRATEQYE